MNPLKDAKLQSSLQFFNARIKNQYEDLKLQREIRHLDRRIGMTNADFKREIQAVRKEMEKVRKSSGWSEEGRVHDSEDSMGGTVKGNMGNSRAERVSKRAKSAGIAITPKKETSVWERLKRPKSAPGVFKEREGSKNTISETMVELPVTKTRLNAKTCYNFARRKGQDDWDSPLRDAVKTRQGLRTAHVNVSWRLRPHTVDTAKLQTQTTNQTKETIVELRDHTTKRSQSATAAALAPSNSEPVTGKRTSFMSNSTIEGSPSKSYDHVSASAKPKSLRYALKATPVSDGPVASAVFSPASDSAKTGWLKSALKIKTNGNENEKRVTIMENGEIHKHAGSNSKPFLGQKNKTDDGGTDNQDTSDQTHSAPSLGLLSLLMSRAVQPGTPPSPTPNVIPEVRRKPKQTVEDAAMKKRRDRLLKASIVSLMGGGRSRRKSPLDADAITQEEDESKLSAAKRSPRRFSFRTMGKVMMSKKHLTVQKRSTLGTRLKVHPVQQSAMTKKSIKANLTINDDESDSGNEVIASSTLKPEASVGSKIAKSWRQDLDLDKPPVLEDDVQQLHKHLAASHISRERELDRMQQQQEVNHLKVIDEDRQKRVMSKVRLFISILEEQRRRDKQERRRLEMFGAPSTNPVVQRWRNAAKVAVRKK